MENAKIIREDELLRKPFGFVRGRIVLPGNRIQLDNTAEFLRFCNDHLIGTVFYSYRYYDRAKYTATEEIAFRTADSEKERALFSSWMEKYNKQAEAMDFSEPVELLMAASFEGIIVCAAEKNEWMTLRPAEEDAEQFYLDNENEIADEGMALQDRLAEDLLADKTFRYCQNKDQRRAYMSTFLKDPQNKKYRRLITGETKWAREESIGTIVDRIYNEYRNECYRKKILVGEELPKK